MAKAKKRAAARKKSSKRRKQSANPSRKKLGKRTTAKKAKAKAKAKFGRAGVRPKKAVARKKSTPNVAAREASKQAPELSLEAMTNSIETVPVVAVTENESVRTGNPLATGDALERDEGRGPETKSEAA
jgi:hypothetical protein